MKAKCEDMLATLKDRAIKQVTVAFELLLKQGHGYRFHDVEDGKPIDYDDCIGCYNFVIRKGTLPSYGSREELLYFTQSGWKSLRDHDNVTILAQSADYLLMKAREEFCN